MVILPQGLFKFQEKCVRYLLDQTLRQDGRQTIVVKAPTGSGKTVILIAYMDAYLSAGHGSMVESNVQTCSCTAFIWLCPGKGDLEEQSRRRMQQIWPNRGARNLADALNGGFEAGTVTFINWELVTKKDNNAIKDTERQNLYERIAQARREGISFVAVIDEEHSNKTAKADTIIRALNPLRLIRMSATTTGYRDHEFYEVEEQEVINEGLITRAVCVNEGVYGGTVGVTADCPAELQDDSTAELQAGCPAELQDDSTAELSDDRLIELADVKRRQIAAAYQQLGVNVRPLVLIQFPNGKPGRVAEVESRLAAMGYTYENGLAAKWMASDKRALSGDITDNAGMPVFLLMKQAVSVGWDCPRAKILVKLREGGSEIFQIQTVGRIRRMPERKHYDMELLDQSYVYTLDREYKAGLLSDVKRAYEADRQSHVEGGRTASLPDVRPNVSANVRLNVSADAQPNTPAHMPVMPGKPCISDRALFTAVWRYYVENCGLTEDMNRNREILLNEGYVLSASPDCSILPHIVEELKAALEAKTGSIKAGTVKSILERLFRDKGDRTQKLLALETGEFYAFIIHNRGRLVRDFNRIADIITGEGQADI